jgi:hypothetical protein
LTRAAVVAHKSKLRALVCVCAAGAFNFLLTPSLFGAPPCIAGMPWGTQETSIMRILAHKYLRSFSLGHGHFMWNFRTELEDRWSYLQVGRGQKGVVMRNGSGA